MDTFPDELFNQHFYNAFVLQGIRDLFKMFNEKKQDLILWRIKPSIVRILTSIMELGGVPFKHCYTEEQLENILEGMFSFF